MARKLLRPSHVSEAFRTSDIRPAAVGSVKDLPKDIELHVVERLADSSGKALTSITISESEKSVIMAQHDRWISPEGHSEEERLWESMPRASLTALNALLPDKSSPRGFFCTTNLFPAAWFGDADDDGQCFMKVKATQAIRMARALWCTPCTVIPPKSPLNDQESCFRTKDTPPEGDHYSHSSCPMSTAEFKASNFSKIVNNLVLRVFGRHGMANLSSLCAAAT